MSPTDSSQLKILAFRTIPYGLLAVLCSTLTYVGITPVRGAESIPLLHALSSPFSIVLWIAATLTFAALFAVSAVKQHRLLDLEARREFARLRDHRRRLIRELAGEGFEFRWEAAPPRWESRVRNLRRARGWTFDELAELLNISSMTLECFELGCCVPNVRTAWALADLFGRPIEDLFWPAASDVHPETADEREPFCSSNPAVGSSRARLECLAKLLDSGREMNRTLLLRGLTWRAGGEENPEKALEELVDADLLASRNRADAPTFAERVFARIPRTRVVLSLTPAGRRAVMDAYGEGAGERQRRRRHEIRLWDLERRYLSALAPFPSAPFGFLSKSAGLSEGIVEYDIRGLERRGLVCVVRDQDTDSVALTDLGRARAEELAVPEGRERRW